MEHTSLSLIEMFDTTLSYYCKYHIKYILSIPVLSIILIIIVYLYYQFSLLASENSSLKIQNTSLSESVL